MQIPKIAQGTCDPLFFSKVFPDINGFLEVLPSLFQFFLFSIERTDVVVEVCQFYAVAGLLPYLTRVLVR